MDLKLLQDVPPWDWPEDLNRTLLKILRDDRAQEEDRLLAAEMAGDLTVTNEELVEVLLSILVSHTASENLRGQAAISLGPVLEQTDMDSLDEFDDAPISEELFHRVQSCLQKLYADAEVPKYVRRRILEAAVRAPQDWHPAAVRTAYCSDDRDWKLTAVFAMRWVGGFDDQIVEALDSEDCHTRYQAIRAAGNWEIDAAWSQITGIVTARNPDKGLLLAAVAAVASIRPREAPMILGGLVNSDDEDIVEAALEALAMAEVETRAEFGGEDLDEDDDESVL